MLSNSNQGDPVAEKLHLDYLGWSWGRLHITKLSLYLKAKSAMRSHTTSSWIFFVTSPPIQGVIFLMLDLSATTCQRTPYPLPPFQFFLGFSQPHKIKGEFSIFSKRPLSKTHHVIEMPWFIFVNIGIIDMHVIYYLFLQHIRHKSRYNPSLLPPTADLDYT